MTLHEFPTVLLAAELPVYHQIGPDQPGGCYAVWQEYAGRRQTGGPLKVWNIQVDVYTKTELDPTVDRVLQALTGADVYYEEPEISYEAETGYTRYMIECQIIDTTITRRITNGQSK